MDDLLSLNFSDRKKAISELGQLQPKTIGFYYGSFDPFHDGHMEVAEIMLKFCDTVLITTLHKNRHKPLLSQYEHRVAMINNYLKNTTSPIYYFKDDLSRTAKRLSYSFHLCGIMGSDVFLRFQSDSDQPKLKVQEWFVTPRDNYSLIEFKTFNDIKTTILTPDLFHKQHTSSTQIREAFQTGNLNEIALLYENIQYINTHRLY